MSLWSDYLLERLGHEVIEVEEGFAQISFVDGICGLENIYVLPLFRKTGVAGVLLGKVTLRAKELGCTKVATQVWPSIKGADAALSAAIKYGFKLISADNRRILMIKEIGG